MCTFAQLPRGANSAQAYAPPSEPFLGLACGRVADTHLAFSAWKCPTCGEKVLQPLDPCSQGSVGLNPIPQEAWALHGEGGHTGFGMIRKEESEW